jgi:alkanesulfonate monooxygenase SsuD/methylene tetrahydromethanopterin reductase-like flavin-dependent oxidoreductase (luciferase family)
MERHVSPERAEEQVRLYRHNSGTPEQVIASLKEWEALGLAYAIVYFPDAAYDLSSIDLFAREVIPAFN